MAKRRRILGVDPGTRRTGWGVLDVEGQTLALVGCGTIAVDKEKDLHRRLVGIYEELREVVDRWAPEESAVESLFHARNASSALKLGHARGVTLLALSQGGMPIHEYAPREVKATVTGDGSADKAQVARMIKLLLGGDESRGEDTNDALAVAVCHSILSRAPR